MIKSLIRNTKNLHPLVYTKTNAYNNNLSALDMFYKCISINPHQFLRLLNIADFTQHRVIFTKGRITTSGVIDGW